MILVATYLVPKGYSGIAVFPFVFVKRAELKRDLLFINHERIHLKQQIELLIFPFFIWYVVEFLFRYHQYGNWYQAYRNISFEREAYQNEHEPNYLKHRPVWRFLKYLYRHDL